MPVIFLAVEMDKLDGDEFFEAAVVGFVDSTHTSLPEAGHDLVAAIKDGPGFYD